MKKQILLFASLCITLSLSAGTAIGLKAGLQSSKIYEPVAGPNPQIYYPTLRTNLGLVCNFGYSNFASFQMELNYSRKGSTVSSNEKLTYGYFELPLLLKLSGGGEKFKIFGLIGPYIACPLQEKYVKGDVIKYASASQNTNYPLNLSTVSVIERMDIGFHVGGGVTYQLGPGRLLAEIRLCQGYGHGFIEDSFNTQVWQFNVGYLFTFGE